MTPSIAVSRFFCWQELTCSEQPLRWFRIAFALIWIVYDSLDLAFGGIQSSLWLVPDPRVHQTIFVNQIVLIALELGLLIGWKPGVFALAACAARGFQASYFALNDLLYYCATALILSQAGLRLAQDRGSGKVLAWPRDLLVLQTAWIYFATAFLKLNAPFLSGGDLYVRQNYLATALHWPYPEFYRTWIARLGFNALLSWMAVVVELSLALVLFAWWHWIEYRPRIRRVAIFLVVGIHVFGAAALNVFFFSLSMIAQVVLLTWEPIAPREGQSA